MALTILPACPGNVITVGDVGGACNEDGTCNAVADFCNGALVCNANNVCEDGPDPCPESETCNEEADRCEECTADTAATACDDTNVCTTDTCTDVGRCDNTDPGCDDGDACTENDACDPAGEAGNCAGTEVVCPAGEECDPADGMCVAAGCTEDADCDDEDLCTDDACEVGACVFTDADCDDGDACTDDSCDDATGDCVNTDMVCDVEGEECVDGACVEAGLRASISDCPAMATSGSMYTPTTSVSGATGQATTTLTSTSGTEDDTTVTFGNGSGVVCVQAQDNDVTPGTDPVVSTDVCTVDADCTTAGDTCNGDSFCETPGTAEVLTPVGDPVEFCCPETAVEFTAELLCNAGNFAARRANPAGIAAIMATSSATQSGADGTGFAHSWTVVSQPTGSGAVAFNNQSIANTTFAIGVPATAGDYVLNYNVVNPETNSSCDSMSTLQLFDNPVFQCNGTAVARRNVEHGTMVTIQVQYNVTDTTTFNIYAKETAANNGVNQVLLATLGPVAATGGVLVDADVVIDTSLMTTGAGSYLLGWEAIDAVGLFNGGGTATLALAKATADEAIVGRRQCVLYVGRNPQQGAVAAVDTTSATAANPAEPTGLTAATEIGTPVSVGTGNAAAAFNAGNVQYPGVGDTAGPRVLTHTAGTVGMGVDVNGDGLGDTVLANAGNIQVLFGAVDTLTDNNGGATTPIGLAAAAGAAAAVAATANQDWGAAGAFVANETSQFAVTTAPIVDLHWGDYNNDNQLDFSYTGDGVGATGAAGLVFLAGNASNLDPFTNAVERIYTSAGAGSEAGSGAAHGDFNGDGRVDAGFGFPQDDTGAANQGAAYIVYGQIETTTTLGSGFAAAAALEATFATSANGYAFHGTGAADLCGGSLMLADVTGGDSADAVFEQRLQGAVAASGRIVVVAGSANTDQPDDAASFSLTDPVAADFLGIQFASGDLTSGTKNDLVVGAPNFDSGTSGGAVNEGAVFVLPSTSLGNGNINGLSGVFSAVNNRVGVGNNQLALGGAVGVFDYNGDGNMDVVTTHNAVVNNTVYVLNGPLVGTGINFNNTQNGFNFRIETATAFTQIGWGDVNGDGVGDAGLFATNIGVVINGLER